VAEVLVEEGQVVEAGQPLARLEPDDLELQVAQAQAVLAAAEAQLAQLLALPRPQGVAVQGANLAAARAQLDELQAGADADQVRAAQANVATAAAQRGAVQAQLDLLLAGTTAEEMGYPTRTTDSARLPLPVGLQPGVPPLVGRPG
jgi:multidrug efflux pump subunit AcrA (membrane-fusion protein)